MDGPSEKQIAFVRALRERIGLSEDELKDLIAEVAEDEDCRSVESLSRKEASAVIDELMIKAKEKGLSLESPRATEKQVSFMLSLKRRAHLTDVEFGALLDDVAKVKDPAQVSKRDASSVIDRLLALANEQKDPKARGKGTRESKGAQKPAAAKKPPPEPEEEPGEEEEDVPF
jgi:hypothetical protein